MRLARVRAHDWEGRAGVGGRQLRDAGDGGDAGGESQDFGGWRARTMSPVWRTLTRRPTGFGVGERARLSSSSAPGELHGEKGLRAGC